MFCDIHILWAIYEWKEDNTLLFLLEVFKLIPSSKILDVDFQFEVTHEPFYY